MSNDFSASTYVLCQGAIEEALLSATSGIKDIYLRPPKTLVFEMNDGSEITVDLPDFKQWYNVTQAEFDLLTPNPTIKDNYYVIDNKEIVYCDGTQFIPISTTIQSLTVDEQDVIIKKCVGDYYISTATKLTQNDLMNITAKNNYLSTSDLNTFMQMLK